MATDNEIWIKVAAYLGAAFTMGIGTIAPAISQGMVGKQACKTMGENPESASKVNTAMLISMSLIETSAIYALLISLFLIFRN